MLTALALLAVTGPEAVDIAKTFFTKAGVKGPLRLRQLDPPGPTFPWRHVVFDAPGDKIYEASVSLSGRLKAASLRDVPSAPLRSDPLHSVRPEVERRLRNWLKLLAPLDETKLALVFSDEVGLGVARFEILRNRIPFVGGRRFGYQFVFTNPEGDFRSMSAEEDIPPVDSPVPRITARQALEAAKPMKRGFSHIREPEPTYEFPETPTLGYLAPHGATLSRLVLKVPFTTKPDPTRPNSRRGFGPGDIFVDAQTGQPIPSNDGGWGQ